MGFDTSRFKEVMSRFASGVTVVSGMEGDEPVGFTCQAFISLSAEPPFVAVAPARTSTSWPRIARAGSFCVNILGDEQSEMAQGFAVSGGPKFDGVDWRPAPITGAPVIEGSLAWVDCLVELVHDAGDHELIIGKVLELGTGEGSPLIYYESKFAALAKHDVMSGEGPRA
jgi:flavin reductase (DIM6/NTAB) family NADH-FMN oxidoreductase RutF